MNEGKASKPTEKLSKKSGFFLWLFLLNVPYYLDVLFLKIVGYHDGSDTNIILPVCILSFSSTKVCFAIPVTVAFVLASPPMPIL